MKSLKYIWRNVKRNKLRTSLTILSVGFSLALMTERASSYRSPLTMSPPTVCSATPTMTSAGIVPSRR